MSSNGHPRPPSGQQHEIRLGDQRAVIVEVGGGLRAYDVAGRAVLQGYEVDERARGARGQVLLPWPNRIEDGSYEFEGRKQQLALTKPANHNASHGLVRWVNWALESRAQDRVTMHHVLYPQPGYPFTLDLTLRYVLSAQGLTVTATATNVGAEPCPYGHGFHPYLTLGTASVDGLQLSLPARQMLLSDARGIPTGSMVVDGTPFDFRDGRLIGDAKLDNAFTAFARDAEGRVRARLSDPRAGSQVTLWADQAYNYLMVFTGDTLSQSPRRGLALEPMTCPPNAFRSGDGVIRLAPDESHSASWGLSPEPR
jgi:aldose 1-epimerase